jgi:hypothetical protein
MALNNPNPSPKGEPTMLVQCPACRSKLTATAEYVQCPCGKRLKVIMPPAVNLPALVPVQCVKPTSPEPTDPSRKVATYASGAALVALVGFGIILYVNVSLKPTSKGNPSNKPQAHQTMPEQPVPIINEPLSVATVIDRSVGGKSMYIGKRVVVSGAVSEWGNQQVQVLSARGAGRFAQQNVGEPVARRLRLETLECLTDNPYPYLATGQVITLEGLVCEAHLGGVYLTNCIIQKGN